jgi:hypothetical protein
LQRGFPTFRRVVARWARLAASRILVTTKEVLVTRWMRNICLSVCFSPVAAVAASEIHQCEERGNVIYQQAPCTRGAAVKRWPPYEAAKPREVASPVLAAEGRARASRKPSRPSRNSRRVSAPGAAIGRSRGGGDAACESMRRKRAAAYEKAGLKRNFALSSHWDNKVQQACQ